MTAREQWRPVVGYESVYEVSDQGRVRSIDRYVEQTIARGADRTRKVVRRMPGRILKPVKIKAGGYLRVSLSDRDRKPRPRKIHQLVTAAFIGPRPDGKVPLHGDGNPENNRLDNLRYGTGAENIADAKAHGTFVIGSRRSQAKLNEHSAGAIKALVDERPSVLARAFGVSIGTVQLIRRGANWPHVSAMALPDARRELDRRAA